MQRKQLPKALFNRTSQPNQHRLKKKRVSFVAHIGATELLLVAIIGLVVVGPERLPRLARTLGLWLKRLRGQVASIQKGINQPELEWSGKPKLDNGADLEDGRYCKCDDPLGLQAAKRRYTDGKK